MVKILKSHLATKFASKIITELIFENENSSIRDVILGKSNGGDLHLHQKKPFENLFKTRLATRFAMWNDYKADFGEFLDPVVMSGKCNGGDAMRGGGLGSRPKKMYGERLGDGVEYHLMKPTPRR